MSERDAQIASMRRDGMTLGAIGAWFDISESRVCQILGRLEFSIPAPRERVQAERRLERERLAAEKREVRQRRDDEVRARWTAGETTIHIGAVLGMDPSIVGRVAKRLGLPQRGKWGWNNRPHATRSAPSADTAYPARVVRKTRLDRELDPSAFRRNGRCCMGATPVVTCLCGMRCCEDHAVMTVDGVRCLHCMAEAAA